MEFSIKTTRPEKQPSECIVVGIYESGKLSAAAASVDKATGLRLTEAFKQGDTDGKLGVTLVLHHLPGISAERVLLVGLGKELEFAEKQYRNAVAAATRRLNETGAKNATVYLVELVVGRRSTAWRVRQFIMVASDVLYRFDRLKSKPENTNRPLGEIGLAVGRVSERAEADQALLEGIAIAAGTSVAKDLGNLPGNICTPAYLAEQAVALGEEFGFAVEVLQRPELEALGMKSFLSVASGSHQPPRFIVMRHLRGAKGDKPIVLIGKGITFDTGGISLKPAPEMDEMKYDMCGAASVIGAFRTASMLRLPINLIGLIPTTENMPGGGATRPGDVVTSMSGQTIEILNTDAEGRLILCDALTYAERFKPKCVIDIATLTGACVISLGHVASGMFANDQRLGDELLDCGDESHDRVWRMPLWDDYQEQLKSNFADMANIGGRPAGSITAACFLSRFATKYPWGHLDIAGTAWKSGKDKGATGRPVPLLSQFLLGRAARRAGSRRHGQ